jgi:hypothetical protein
VINSNIIFNVYTELVILISYNCPLSLSHVHTQFHASIISGARLPAALPFHNLFKFILNKLTIHISFLHADNLEDNEDKNLSWLFNFKLDEIANLSPEIKRKRINAPLHQSENHQNYYNSTTQPQHQIQVHQYDDHHANNQRITKDPCIEDDLNVAENIVISNTPPSLTSTHT